MSSTKKGKSSTAQNWNIKGIEPETRQKVTMAAKKAGLTIGAYVNRKLLDAATQDLKRKKDTKPPVKYDELQQQMAEMNKVITQLIEDKNKPLWKKIF